MNLRIVQLLCFALLIALPLGSWWLNIGGAARLSGLPNEPDGQGAYLFSRLAGLGTIALITGQMLLGMSSQQRSPFAIFNSRSWPKTAHAILGISCLLLAWAHVLLFVVAVSLRQGSVASHLMFPNVADYYHMAQAIGLLALYLMSTVVLIRRVKNRWRTYGHRLAYAVPPLAIIHSLFIGSDTRDPVLLLFYGLSIGMLGIAIWFRFFYGYRVIARSENA